MILLTMFLEFFKVGLFAIGGGLATIPFLQELANKYNWYTSQELVDMIAVSESTPGPIGINMATYVGYKVGGIPGVVTAVTGIVMPSVIVIILIAHFYSRFNEKPLVKSAFYGLRPAVTGLIAAAGFEVARISLLNIEKFFEKYNVLDLINIKSLILFAVILFLTNKYKKHPIVYLVFAAIIGIVFKF
ncbi:MAG TPA: chromate transporter [Clostridiaceae bacterium]|nr:chromate transporter [Clostridiaceae bacterium]